MKQTLHTKILSRAGYPPPMYPQTNTIITEAFESYRKQWGLDKNGHGSGWGEGNDKYYLDIGPDDGPIVRATAVKGYGVSTILKMAGMEPNIPAALKSDPARLDMFLDCGMITIVRHCRK